MVIKIRRCLMMMMVIMMMMADPFRDNRFFLFSHFTKIIFQKKYINKLNVFHSFWYLITISFDKDVRMYVQFNIPKHKKMKSMNSSLIRILAKISNNKQTIHLFIFFSSFFLQFHSNWFVTQLLLIFRFFS